MLPALASLAPDVFSPNGVDQQVAQRQQRLDPARRASRSSVRRRCRASRRAIVDRDAVGVDELRAGEQRGRIDRRV